MGRGTAPIPKSPFQHNPIQPPNYTTFGGETGSHSWSWLSSISWKHFYGSIELISLRLKDNKLGGFRSRQMEVLLEIEDHLISNGKWLHRIHEFFAIYLKRHSRILTLLAFWVKRATVRMMKLSLLCVPGVRMRGFPTLLEPLSSFKLYVARQRMYTFRWCLVHRGF